MNNNEKPLKEIIKKVAKTKYGNYVVHFMSGGKKIIPAKLILEKITPRAGWVLASCRNYCSGSDGDCIKSFNVECRSQHYYVHKSDCSNQSNNKQNSVKIKSATFVNWPRPRYRIVYGRENDMLMTVSPDNILSSVDIVPGKYITPCGCVCTHRGGNCISRKKRQEHIECAQQFFYISKHPISKNKNSGR